MGDPVVTTFQLPSLPENNYAYVDLSQCASMMNRKFFRQGLNWAVGGFTFMSGAEATGQVVVEKLPDTWVMANSWVHGFKTWQKMNREALDGATDLKPKFLDFKIFMDSVHHSDGVALNKTPVGHNNQPYIRGEWDMSQIIIPLTDGTDDVARREVIGIGANYPGAGGSGLNAVSLIEGYAASRSLPYETDPNTPTDARDTDGATPANWAAAVFNEGTEQSSRVLDELTTENNEAPYPFENGTNPAGGTFTDTMYPGGANNPNGGGTLELHDFATVSGTTVGQKTTLRGGTFQCGLIKISNDTNQAMDVLIHLIPGNHRGYLAEPMQDVN